MTKDQDTPTKDHNGSPLVDEDRFAELVKTVDDFVSGAGTWLTSTRNDDLDDVSAPKLSDFITGATGLKKIVESRRKDAKKPFDDSGKKVQQLFLPLAEKIELSVSKLKPILAKYLAEKQRIAREEEQERQRQIEQKRAEIEAERRRAEQANDVGGLADAAAAEKAVSKEAKAAPKKTVVDSHTGAGRARGLRKYRVAKLDSFPLACMNYRGNAKLVELLEHLAQADVRASKGAEITIPGFTITEEEGL